MNLCIEINSVKNTEILIDSNEIKKYLDANLAFNTFTDKQIKKKIIEILNDEDSILKILDNLDITYKYFIETLYVNYPTIFTTSFINKHIKNAFLKYRDF